MNLDKPVTAPDNNTVLISKHKRGDRVLIKDKEACHHLKYMCNKYLGKLCPDKLFDYEEEGPRSINLLNVVMRTGEEDVYNILKSVFCNRHKTRSICIALQEFYTC